MYTVLSLYVNDVAENITSVCGLYIYADDNSLQQCSDNINLIEQNLNHDLKWLLKLKQWKTKAVFFHFKNVHHFPNFFVVVVVVVENCQLEYVPDTVREWNAHSLNTREATSVSKYLKNIFHLEKDFQT